MESGIVNYCYFVLSVTVTLHLPQSEAYGDAEIGWVLEQAVPVHTQPLQKWSQVFLPCSLVQIMMLSHPWSANLWSRIIPLANTISSTKPKKALTQSSKYGLNLHLFFCFQFAFLEFL